jgi:osmotically inducible protein OsmC
MKRTASAWWHGDLKTGHGNLNTQSRVLHHTQYSFNSRFAAGIGTNPEELLAAAHAGCFTMAISYGLSQLGFIPTVLTTTATVILNMTTSTISGIELELRAEQIPGLPETEFIKHAEFAKANCLISKALTGIEISLKATYQVEVSAS